MSDLRAALAVAYAATRYCVDTPAGRFALRVGQPLPPAFAAWLRAQGTPCWAVLTACNPGSQRLPDALNAAANRALADAAAQAGCPVFPACNVAERGDWPDEPGFLLLAAEAGVPRALGRRFAQAALLGGQGDEAPDLVWLDPPAE